jgi:hypothetical protein
MRISFYNEDYQKSLMIPKGQSESVNQRRTDNTVSKRKSTITLPAKITKPIKDFRRKLADKSVLALQKVH